MQFLGCCLAAILLIASALAQNIKNKNVHCDEMNNFEKQVFRPKYGGYNYEVHTECVIRYYLLDNEHDYYLNYGIEITDLKIEESTVDSLPLSLLNQLTNLKGISITNSNLTYVDKLSLNGLKHLDFTSNEINSLDLMAFDECPKLENIDLSKNKIQNISTSQFSLNRELKKLNLSNNLLEEIDLALHYSLDSFDLANNQLRSFNLDLSPTKIHNLNVSFNALTSLKLTKSSVEINAESNEISKVEFLSLTLCSSLLKLNLNKNKLGSDLGDICKCTNLEILMLNFNNIDNISSCFSQMTKLKTLSLRNNQIHYLNHDSFHAENKIEHLDLSFNQIEIVDEYTMSIFSQLKYLYLNGNQISNFMLIPKLYMPSLEVVGLSHNKLRCSTLFTLMKNFKMNGLAINRDRTVPVNTTNIDGISCYQNHEGELLKSQNNLETILKQSTKEDINFILKKINTLEDKLVNIFAFKRNIEESVKMNTQGVNENKDRLNQHEEKIEDLKEMHRKDDPPKVMEAVTEESIEY
ncbi:leucine-rich repeat-containing G-protein coupled receptor 5-like [Lutzomyia longipalpis]|uniref:leucine-rich repeat-containing G-protein coupled receptor 5-like n=1 Tax=Lutzomyia longipalpis TaxID=7200 RepID=UPI0024837998|nr:leucine-rich repeat-containing G-protein coupled receptor 5-like [Lutzomyia longipalpis]